jgi:hypothetical protein
MAEFRDGRWVNRDVKDIAFDEAMARLEAKQTEANEWEETYRMLGDQVIQSFNPPDDDAAEVSILIDAVVLAFNFIKDQPCTCKWNEEPYQDVCDTCKRCVALGREFDIQVER